MLSVNNLVRPPKRASVEGEAPKLLLKLQDIDCKKAPSPTHVDTLAVLLDDILLEPADCMEGNSGTMQPMSPKECILDHLAGYVVKKFATMACSCCVQTLKNSTRKPNDLTAIRSKGYLQVPSDRLLGLLKIVEGYVEEFTVEKIACPNLYMNIIESILHDNRIPSASVGCPSHFVETTAEVIHFFLRCRLHFFTREKNKKSRESSCRSCPASGGKLS
ncbi:uncharacterized protein LOC144118864 [Amblyomma americanum]